jgi:hypothetical protein
VRLNRRFALGGRDLPADTCVFATSSSVTTVPARFLTLEPLAFALRRGPLSLIE